jgi:hypothetical protein
MASPYVSDGTKKILGLMLQQQMGDKVSYQTTPDGDILALDPHGRAAPKVVYQATPKPIAVPENSQLWDPRTKTFLSGGAQVPTSVPGPGKTTIPVPPNLSPRDAREFTKKIAEGTAAAALPVDYKETQKMREDIVQLPAYKNLAQAAPVYRDMRGAADRDNRAADLNLIYGFGKIMDPGSVVRESEMTMAQKINTLPEYLRATVESQLSGSGRLSPEVRAQILAEAHGRVTAYKGEFDRDATRFKGIAERSRINPADVLPEFGSFEPWTPPKKAGAEAGATPTPAAIDDLVKKYSK